MHSHLLDFTKKIPEVTIGETIPFQCLDHSRISNNDEHFAFSSTGPLHRSRRRVCGPRSSEIKCRSPGP